MNIEVIVPDWPAPAAVRCMITTRRGGRSTGRFASMNLGTRVGDDPARVAENRALLATIVTAQPLWLTQVHGTNVVDAQTAHEGMEADAAIGRAPGRALAVLTADCLPVLLCDREASAIAVAHAGWRGLAAGVIENTVAKLGLPAERLMAFLGPAIGPAAYEVGPEVKDAFVRRLPGSESAFQAGRGDRFMADLYALARQRLAKTGIMSVHGGRYCTFSDADRFFSYRRDGETGRMASLIWLAA